MKKQFKQAGYFLLTALPFCMFQLLSLAVARGVFYVLRLRYPTQAYAIYTQNIMAVSSLAQLLCLLVFGLWYRWLRRPCPPKAPPRRQTLGLLLAAALALQLTTTLLVQLLAVLRPQWLTQYQALLEQSGVAQLSLFSTLATLVAAPIGEELAFRGVTLALARRAGLPFWLANFLQALLFALAHGNWMQGAYAFTIALAFGWVYHCYGRLWAPILLHFGYNFCGTYLTTLLALTGVANWVYFALAFGALAGLPQLLARLKTDAALYQPVLSAGDEGQGPAPEELSGR